MNGSNVQDRPCAVDDCAKRAYAKRYCVKHYRRFRRYGDPLTTKRRMDGTASYLNGNVGYIDVGQGLWAMVDAEDFERVNRYRWTTCRNAWGGVYAYGYMEWKGAGRNMSMSRFLMDPPAGMQVDHINRNTLDNRRSCNLRNVEPYQNCQNRRRPSDNRSGYKGVSWDRAARRWEASLTCQGIKHDLGSFATPQAAARAYNRKARELGFLYVPPDPE
jgi:hypothetical protein